MAKNNKRYIIYINQEYIRCLVAMGDDYSHEAVKRVRDEVYKQINDFLMGEGEGCLCGMTFIGPDGKEHKSFEVVRVSDCKTIADIRYFNRLRKRKHK